jgi:signal transduction histidine kinase
MDVSFVQGDGPGQNALDSVASTIGLLLALIFYGRYLQSRSQADALLCAALLALATANATFAVVPRVAGGGQALSTASACAGLFASGLYAAAVWTPPSVVDVGQRHRVPVLIVALVASLLMLSWLLADLLPRHGGSADTFGGERGGLLTVTQLLAAAFFASAAVGWSRASMQGEPMASSLAIASVLASASRLDFGLSTSSSSAWASSATVLRMGFYATLIVYSVLVINGYWRSIADVAVLEERRRIARDLHDGLAQELAFIVTQARALSGESSQPSRAQLVAGAAERALDESRRAIAALSRPLDEPLGVAVTQCAEDVCGRFEAALVLDVQADLEASADVREALLRIVREAISNAVRHGGASGIVVRLDGPSPLRLDVEDDGVGFDLDDLTHHSGHLGLASMRERAEALGGTFTLSRREPAGMRVEVVLP